MQHLHERPPQYRIGAWKPLTQCRRYTVAPEWSLVLVNGIGPVGAGEFLCGPEELVARGYVVQDVQRAAQFGGFSRMGPPSAS